MSESQNTIAIRCDQIRQSDQRESCAYYVESCFEQREQIASGGEEAPDGYQLLQPDGRSTSLSSFNRCLDAASFMPTYYGPLPESVLATREIAKETPKADDDVVEEEVVEEPDDVEEEVIDETDDTIEEADDAIDEDEDAIDDDEEDEEETEYPHCASFDAGSAAFTRCTEVSDICMDEEPPYSLPVGEQTLTVHSEENCLKWAQRIARSTPSKKGRTRKKKTRKRPAHHKSTEFALWRSDGKTRFHVPLDEVSGTDGTRLALRVGKHQRETFRLRFYKDGQIYGPEVNFNYSLESTGGGRYRLTYTISNRNGGGSGKKRSITISADKRGIRDTLVFGIKTQEKNATVTSIQLVKM